MEICIVVLLLGYIFFVSLSRHIFWLKNISFCVAQSHCFYSYAPIDDVAVATCCGFYP